MTRMELQFTLVLLESCLHTCMTCITADCIVNKLLMMDRKTVRNIQCLMRNEICENSASSWFYYKEICYDARSRERKKRTTDLFNNVKVLKDWNRIADWSIMSLIQNVPQTDTSAEFSKYAQFVRLRSCNENYIFSTLHLLPSCETWGSHGDIVKGLGLFGWDAVLIG
jgi:hypothetical protein